MGAFDGGKTAKNEDNDLKTRVRLLEQRRAGGMNLRQGNWNADGKKVINLHDGSTKSDAATKGQMDAALALKTNKADQIVLSNHMDANYHSILNIQTAGDNDAFSLFHGKTVFMTTNGNEFSAKNQPITRVNTVESDDGSAVNMITLKKFHPNAPAPTHEVTKDLDLKHRFSVINAKQFGNWAHYVTNYDQVMPFEDIRHGFLSRREVTPMEADLNMNQKRIFNLKTPQFGGEAATKEYVDTANSTTSENVTSTLAEKN